MDSPLSACRSGESAFGLDIFVMLGKTSKEITEIKRHLDGREERFECELIAIRPGEAIIRYVWHRNRPFRDGPIYLPAGDSITLAFYWEDRHFLIYKLMASDGTLFGHRFDICEDVKIYPDKIIWADLIVDLWADPENKISVLDEEEVEACKARGLLTPRQLEIIEQTKQYLLKNYKKLIMASAKACPRARLQPSRDGPPPRL